MNAPLRHSVLRGLGELVVIIVGVLIALWADQWWADRQDKQVERAYLAAMLEDIEATIGSLDRNLQNVSRLRQAASELLTLAADGEARPDENLTELLGLALFEIDFFDQRLSTHQDLKNTGRLALITDRDVRHGLAEVERALEEMRTVQGDLVGVHHSIIDPFLVSHTHLPLIVRSGWLATDTGRLERAGVATAGELIPGDAQLELADLLSSKEFSGILAFRIVLLSELMESNIELTEILASLRTRILDALEQ